MMWRVRYWREGEKIGNFGDSLSLVYMDLMFTQRCSYTFGDIYLVGSVIDAKRINEARCSGFVQGDGRGQAIFWGCGARSQRPLEGTGLSNVQFHGVRGELTRKALGLPIGTPIGDTALLLPRFYTPKPHNDAAGKVLWIPHFRHPDPTDMDKKDCPDLLVMRPNIENSTEGCLDMIDAICSSSFVMANAMHAAIIACAYGIPFAFWGGTEINYPFKWSDFSSALGFNMPFAMSFAEGMEIYNRIRPDIAMSNFNGDPLLAVAPFEPRL